MNINRCQSNRYNSYQYLNLNILDEYAEFGNNLCEFVLNSIVLDYVVRTSIRNHRSLIDNIHLSNSNCISLFNINLDTDFLPYTEKMRRICAMSKSTLYEIKITRIAHPTWIVRFSPNFKRILSVFACNLHRLVDKISQIEGHVSKANISGEIIRYHAISSALTTVKYDLLILYMTIRSGGLIAMKTSFLYPILSDIQRWLTYTCYQIKMILSAFPGSMSNRHLTDRSRSILTKDCLPSVDQLINQFQTTTGQSDSSLDESHFDLLNTKKNANK